METKEQPRVRKLYLEYENGSTDQIVLNMSGEIPLYVFIRNRPGKEVYKGVYTHGAMAATLFNTAVTLRRTENYMKVPKLIALLHQWFEVPGSSKPETPQG